MSIYGHFQIHTQLAFPQDFFSLHVHILHVHIYIFILLQNCKMIHAVSTFFHRYIDPPFNNSTTTLGNH